MESASLTFPERNIVKEHKDIIINIRAMFTRSSWSRHYMVMDTMIRTITAEWCKHCHAISSSVVHKK